MGERERASPTSMARKTPGLERPPLAVSMLFLYTLPRRPRSAKYSAALRACDASVMFGPKPDSLAGAAGVVGRKWDWRMLPLREREDVVVSLVKLSVAMRDGRAAAIWKRSVWSLLASVGCSSK